MKKIILTFVLLLSVICGAMAQNDAMYIYRNDGMTHLFLRSEVDSILCSHYDTDSLYHNHWQSQVIYTHTGTCKIPVSAIDSISFIKPVINDSVVGIANEQLHGWDKGYIYTSGDKTFNFLSRTDFTNELSYFTFIEADKSSPKEGITFQWDLNGNLQFVYVEDLVIQVFNYKNSASYLVFDSFGEIKGSFNIENIPNSDNASSKYKRADMYNAVKHNYPKLFEQLKDFVEKSNTVLEGKYGEVIKDILKGSFESAIKMGKGSKLIVDVIEEFIKIHYEIDKRWFMGDASIIIKSAKRINHNEIQVVCELENTSSIPSSRPTVDENGNIGNTTNYVMFGVAQGKNASAGYYLNDRCSNLRYTENDNRTFIFTIPYNTLSEYYFRPFLVPEDYVAANNPNTLIRYGQAKKVVDFSVDIQSCEKDTYSNGVLKLKINAGVDGVLDEIKNWGVRINTKSNDKWNDTYAQDNPYSVSYPRSKVLSCEIDVPESDIVDGKVKVIVTPFYQYRNSSINEWQDSEEYEISLSLCPDNNHPHAIDLGLPSGTKWCCMNVGATSPEGYGGYYAWGETSEKSVYSWETFSYYNKDTYEYIYIGSDIAGTSYDVAHVRMGGPWRMPSVEQQEELVKYCTSTWTQQNGVNGMLMTGVNGGQIFLPAAGHRNDSGLYLAGCESGYWSSSLYSGDVWSAYGLDFKWGNVYWNDLRYLGRSVRAVCP